MRTYRLTELFVSHPISVVGQLGTQMAVTRISLGGARRLTFFRRGGVLGGRDPAAHRAGGHRASEPRLHGRAPRERGRRLADLVHTRISATSTGVGKTFLTCALVRALRAAGRPVQALKPVASGIDSDAPAGSDTALLLEALGRPLTPDAMDTVSPWRFRTPLAPNMAAHREGRSLDLGDVIAFCRRALAAAGAEPWTVIEGIGGVMSPVDDRHTVLDWMAALDLRVTLVAGGYVGTISHTLTALEVLRTRDLNPVAVVLSESGTGDEPPLAETLEALARLAPTVPIIALPRLGPDSAVHHPAIQRVLDLLSAGW